MRLPPPPAPLPITYATATQSALPDILTPPEGPLADAIAEFKRDTLHQLQTLAQFTVEQLSAVPGLKVVVPRGAMYVMFGIDVSRFADIADDVAFCEALVAEENVVCLPGQCFGIPNFVRVVFTSPQDKLAEAYARIASFCARHAVTA